MRGCKSSSKKEKAAEVKILLQRHLVETASKKIPNPQKIYRRLGCDIKYSATTCGADFSITSLAATISCSCA